MNIISTLRGFTFNGKHNKDFGVAMESKTISFPAKKKVKDSVPFMNGEYDFSTIGSNGEIVYSNRDIKIVIGLPGVSKENIQVIYSRLLTWLVDCGKQKLVFDEIRDYYFMAEVESNGTLEQVLTYGKLDITFTAEPFKCSTQLVGNDIWDIFNFEEDYVQDVKYTITNSKTIVIYNPGRTTRPTIKCSTNMTMKINNKTYNLKTGENKLYGFHFTNGMNTMTFNGTGTIEFIFRKEML